jgi:peptidoglycan/LPS O-acetylase OafA/YrhL
LSVLALFRTAQRARLCAIIGLLIAFASPLVSMLNWPHVPGPLKVYLAPDQLAFGFFPWAAFVAFGMSAGSIVRLVRKDQLDRVMQWAAVLGLFLIVAAWCCSELRYSLYARSEFWLNSPWLILIKLGVVLLILTVAYLWTQYGAAPGWSWIGQFGTTSLFVYWVHTELVYGRWLYFWKESLTPAQAALAALGVILLMLGLSVAKTNYKNWRPARLTFDFPLFVPRRVPGD